MRRLGTGSASRHWRHSCPEVAGEWTVPRRQMKGKSMAATLSDVEWAVRVMAETVVANEAYFGDLDAVVGDGDFGYSMARGFGIVLSGWGEFDPTDISTFLKKIAVTITSRIGGTSGPIWGTGFLRAATTAAGEESLDAEQIAAMLGAVIEGIQARGGAGVGDKTLLDALVPA